MFKEYKFSFAEVRPEPSALISYLQLPDMESYSLVRDIVDKTFNTLASTEGIRGGYRIFNCESVDIAKGEIVCQQNTIETGRRISGYMKKATQVALFVCTAGSIFTTLAQNYQKNGDFLEAFVVDSIGSATVENAMNSIQHSLEKEMKKEGKKITNRYSPGYCEWSLSGQRSLFRTIGENPTGIKINESCLMQPIKSVSGIIGIGQNVKKCPYGCKICRNETCVYRNLKK